MKAFFYEQYSQDVIYECNINVLPRVNDSFFTDMFTNDRKFTHFGNGKEKGSDWGFIVTAVTYRSFNQVIISVRHGLIDNFYYPHEQNIKEHLLS